MEYMEELLLFFRSFRAELLLIVLSSFIFVVSGVLFMSERNVPVDQYPVTQEEPVVIRVEVAGAVKKPDVYSFNENTRLKDVLEKAILSDSADRIYISRTFNLARYVKDQEKIYVPSQEEVNQGLFPTDTSSLLQRSSYVETERPILVDINLATLPELDALPGIGKTTAQKIIDARPYSSINELTDKKILSLKQFNQLKHTISVGE